MVKADLIRDILETTVPSLKTSPDKMEIYIDEGLIVGTGSHSASFEYQYTLNIIIKDFAQSPNMIVVPIMEFIRENQTELVDNPDRRKDGFKFIADKNNHDSIDLAIYLKLTERVIVKEENGVNIVKHLDEPRLIDRNKPETYKLYIKDEFIEEWQMDRRERP